MMSKRTISPRSKCNCKLARNDHLLMLSFLAASMIISIVMVKVAWDVHNYDETRDAVSNKLESFAGGPSLGGVSENGGQRTTPTNQHQQQLQQQQLRKRTSALVEKLVNRSQRIELPDENRTLAFVHIGKSGGSTISLLLRNGCMSAADGTPCDPPDRWRRIPGQNEETIASRRIQFYLHTPHVESGRMAEYYARVTSVVAVARDPLERFVSAFLSRHPANLDAARTRNALARKRAEREGKEPPVWAKPSWGYGDAEQDQANRAAYKGCYPNLDQFAKCADTSLPKSIPNNVYKTRIRWYKGKGMEEKEISLNCREICLGIMSGVNNYIYIPHLRFNYGAFLKDLPPQSEVFVIRTRKLWDDLRNVNRMLGSENDMNVPDKFSAGDRVNARGKMPVRNNWSFPSRMIICKSLMNEIRIYINLLNRAVNLSDDDVQSEIESIQRNCPNVLQSLVDYTPRYVDQRGVVGDSTSKRVPGASWVRGRARIFNQ
ncbi:hypothetical protein ACHAWF_015894 [Thalassiosira exigua]